MNKTIKQFESQSNIDVYALGLNTVKWEARLGKFAELLVKETLKQVNDNMELTWVEIESKILDNLLAGAEQIFDKGYEVSTHEKQAEFAAQRNYHYTNTDNPIDFPKESA